MSPHEYEQEVQRLERAIGARLASYEEDVAEWAHVRVGELLPDLTLIGPERGAELRRMIYGS